MPARWWSEPYCLCSKLYSSIIAVSWKELHIYNISIKTPHFLLYGSYTASACYPWWTYKDVLMRSYQLWADGDSDATSLRPCMISRVYFLWISDSYFNIIVEIRGFYRWRVILPINIIKGRCSLIHILWKLWKFRPLKNFHM